jgi:hypothetical protein
MSPSDDNDEGSYSLSCDSSSGDDGAHHLQSQSSEEEEDDDCADDARSQVTFDIRSISTLATTTTTTTTTKATRWSKTARMPTRGRSKATNVVDDGWGCGFLRVARKAISNGKGNADDNLQDDAATDIFSNDIGIDGH